VNQAFSNFRATGARDVSYPGGQSHGPWCLVEARKLRSNKRFHSFTKE